MTRDGGMRAPRRSSPAAGANTVSRHTSVRPFAVRPSTSIRATLPPAARCGDCIPRPSLSAATWRVSGFFTTGRRDAGSRQLTP